MRVVEGCLLLAALMAPAAGATGLNAPAPGAGLTFSPSGAPIAPPPPAPPGAGEALYLDWVSPLQAPRGLAMPGPGEAVAPLPPAHGALAQAPTLTPVPEPASLGLLAIGLLPFAPLVCRRRSGPRS